MFVITITDPYDENSPVEVYGPFVSAESAQLVALTYQNELIESGVDGINIDVNEVRTVPHRKNDAGKTLVNVTQMVIDTFGELIAEYERNEKEAQKLLTSDDARLLAGLPVLNRMSLD